MFRVRFLLDPSEWHGHSSERLWAQEFEDAPPRLELRNTPFFAKGVSFLDIVDVTLDEATGDLEFKSVVRRSGHSTYRIYVYSGATEAFARRWHPLFALGCSYESTSGDEYTLYAVDVPPSADVQEAHARLVEGQSAGDWLFEEGHVEYAT